MAPGPAPWNCSKDGIPWTVRWHARGKRGKHPSDLFKVQNTTPSLNLRSDRLDCIVFTRQVSREVSVSVGS